MFDFEWINANLYNGLYKRTKSFFDDSELASTGRPASAAELALLAPFPGAVREDILDGTWRPAATDGSGADRIEPKRALTLLKEAGYDIEDGRLDQSGRAFLFRNHGQGPEPGTARLQLRGFARADRRHRRRSGRSMKSSTRGDGKNSIST